MLNPNSNFWKKDICPSFFSASCQQPQSSWKSIVPHRYRGFALFLQFVWSFLCAIFWIQANPIHRSLSQMKDWYSELWNQTLEDKCIKYGKISETILRSFEIFALWIKRRNCGTIIFPLYCWCHVHAKLE